MRWAVSREREGEAIVSSEASAARTAGPEIGIRNKTFNSVWKVLEYLERRAITRLECFSASGSRNAAGLPLYMEYHYLDLGSVCRVNKRAQDQARTIFDC